MSHISFLRMLNFSKFSFSQLNLVLINISWLSDGSSVHTNREGCYEFRFRCREVETPAQTAPDVSAGASTWEGELHCAYAHG